MANQAERFARRDDFLIFGAPYIGDEEIEEVIATLRSGWLGTGPRAAEFEAEFAAYKKAPDAAAVNSGTAALHLALRAAGIGPGDEVITTALTFCATVNAIIMTGATPVLADVDPETMNLSPASVADRITPRTRALLPVHLAGRPCEMDALMQLAEDHRLAVIEDCAHAIEAEYHGRGTGTFGDFGCFSFYVTKNLCTGEGGMVLGRSREALDALRPMALHGLSADAWSRFDDSGYRHYHVQTLGYKYNMPDILAAIGRHQLARIERNWKRRHELWQRYDAAFRDLPVTLPAPPEPGTRHARHLYTLLVEEERCGLRRDDFLSALNFRNIGVGVHYPAIPEHPYYRQEFGWRPEDTPEATRIGRSTVSLPLSAALRDEDADDVIAAVRDTLA